ncbi:hypothetical protein [Azospirillum cavernae]|uniref:hypothetical protein n=1 Tax=Azospirillum cavernae TaxID=2320860 RepID=UPI0011C461A4|nr:hypothetical protein [Azospirillum cavernae]
MMMGFLKKDIPAGLAAVIAAIMAAVVAYWVNQISVAETKNQTRSNFLVEASKASRSELCKMTFPLLEMGESNYINILPKTKYQDRDSIVSKKIYSAPIGGPDNIVTVIEHISDIYEDMQKIRNSDLVFRKEYDDILQVKLSLVCNQKTASAEGGK